MKNYLLRAILLNLFILLFYALRSERLTEYLFYMLLLPYKFCLIFISKKWALHLVAIEKFFNDNTYFFVSQYSLF